MSAPPACRLRQRRLRLGRGRLVLRGGQAQADRRGGAPGEAGRPDRLHRLDRRPGRVVPAGGRAVSDLHEVPEHPGPEGLPGPADRQRLPGAGGRGHRALRALRGPLPGHAQQAAHLRRAADHRVRHGADAGAWRRDGVHAATGPCRQDRPGHLRRPERPDAGLLSPARGCRRNGSRPTGWSRAGSGLPAKPSQLPLARGSLRLRASGGSAGGNTPRLGVDLLDPLRSIAARVRCGRPGGAGARLPVQPAGDLADGRWPERIFGSELERLGRFLVQLGGQPPTAQELAETMARYRLARSRLLEAAAQLPRLANTAKPSLAFTGMARST